MAGNYEMIDQFLSAFLRNDCADIASVLDDNISIDFSTVGKHQGKKDVLKALEWKSFEIHTITVTNELSYLLENGYKKVALIAHFMAGFERGPQLYPVCFGGKFVFTLYKNKILKITYVQEYQAENTLFIKEWKLAKRISNLSSLDFDLNQILAKNPDKKTLVKVFFWALDGKDMDILQAISDSNLHISRLRTMSYGPKFEANSFDTLEHFIDESKNYYSMDQYSLTIRNEDENSVTASHLIPYRLGTKKLNSSTKYNAYYDEDIIVRFKDNKIADVEIKKITDFSPVAFDIRHADELR
jgi:hypothetical protein